MLPAANAETIVLPETSCALNKAEAGNAGISFFLRRIQTALRPPSLSLSFAKSRSQSPAATEPKESRSSSLMLTPSKSLRLMCMNNSLTFLP